MHSTVTLHSILDPSRKVHAVKAVRSATRMSLRDSLDLTNRVPGTLVYDDTRQSPQTLDVPAHSVDELREAFDLTVHASGPEPGSVPRALVLDFVLDILAGVDPEDAPSILNLPSYRALKEALR